MATILCPNSHSLNETYLCHICGTLRDVCPRNRYFYKRQLAKRDIQAQAHSNIHTHVNTNGNSSSQDVRHINHTFGNVETHGFSNKGGRSWNQSHEQTQANSHGTRVSHGSFSNSPYRPMNSHNSSWQSVAPRVHVI